MRIPNRILCAFCFAFVLSGSFPSSTDAYRVGHEGEDWLKMSNQTRRAYAMGYLLGFLGGYERGCDVGTRIVRQTMAATENDPLANCGNKVLHFPDSYSMAKSITDFYSRYPSDRYLYTADVMEALGKGLTLEEIHKYASPMGVMSPE